MEEVSFAVYLPPKFVYGGQMLGLVAVRIAAASCQKHTFVIKTDIVYQSVFVVRHSLFKCPKEVVCCCHKQRAVLFGILFITSQRRVIIFLSNTVKPFDKSLYTR